MHKYAVRMNVAGSGKVTDLQIEAEDIHEATKKALTAFENDNPGKTGNVINIKQIDPVV